MDQQLKQAKTMAEILKIVSDHYDELAAIYNEAENEEDFLKQLAENSQEDYIKLLQWINN